MLQVVLNEIEAVEGIGAPLHHSFQRLLAKAALAPLSMMQNDETEHPLRDLLEKMLSVADMPVASPTITHHRIRFAAHCGLALVSLGAIPGNPGVPALLSVLCSHTSMWLHLCAAKVIAAAYSR